MLHFFKTKNQKKKKLVQNHHLFRHSHSLTYLAFYTPLLRHYISAASFPQGPPPAASLGLASSSSSTTTSSSSSSAAEHEKFSPLLFQYLRSTSEGGRKASQRILVASNNEVRYEGKNFGDEGLQKGAYK